ncbi:MAG: transglutaminase family protein [Clostridia bacterium]|nr:transglutaminase family protein [Clostridia bacterium]
MRRWSRLFLIVFLLIGVILLLCSGALAEDKALWPQTGKNVKKSRKLILDVSYTQDGYFMAAVQKQNKHKLKLRVTKGRETLTYDLNGNAEYEVIPLQLSSGKYEVTLYENVSGKKYSQEGKINLTVKLSREDAAFLRPNQYVNYTQLSEAVAEANRQCEGKSEKEAYETVCGFMKSRFVYDYIKAATIKAGVLPDIDGSFAKKAGICQDLSAIMVCMLRTQGIPSRLMIGYADKQYHAWVTTTVGNKEEFFDPTAALNSISKVKSYTTERYY